MSYKKLGHKKLGHSYKITALIGLCCLISFCTQDSLTPPTTTQQDGPPNLEGVDLSQIPDAIPQEETWARYGNHSPYYVLGGKYEVLQSNENFTQKGIASWYGTKFHGRLTSTREPYDMLAMTAAHKTLPLPSYVLVTNLENQKQIVVKVNDRGPFVEGRIIDLSYAAAHKIDMHEQGTAQVDIKVLPPFLSKPKPETKTVRPNASVVLKRSDFPNGTNNYIQVGVFANEDTANRLEKTLKADFPQSTVIVYEVSGQQTLHKVRVGPLADFDAFLAAQDKLKQQGLPHYYIISD